MRVERNHNLGQQEAKRRIDTFLDALIQHTSPADLTIESPSKNWTGNVMQFSFKAKKGWLGTTLDGSLEVTEQSVVLESNLPGLIKAFVPEHDLQSFIGRHLDDVLGRQS